VAGVAQHDEHPLSRAGAKLLDEGNGLEDPVESMHADDEVGRRRIGVQPAAGDHGHVLGVGDSVPHALRRLDRGHPVQPRRQRGRVAAGAGPDVDQGPSRLQPGLEETQEGVTRREAGRPKRPRIVGRRPLADLGPASLDQLAPGLGPIGADQGIHGRNYREWLRTGPSRQE
jgi:hypothetical protein